MSDAQQALSTTERLALRLARFAWAAAGAANYRHTIGYGWPECVRYVLRPSHIRATWKATDG